MEADLNRVLVICGDQYHPADVVMSGLSAAVGQEFGFEQAPDGPLSGLDGEFTAIVLAKLNVSSPSDKTPWANAESDLLIRKFVEEGKGLFVIHAGTVGYRDAASIRRMTGGAFLRHPEACEVEIAPATSGQEHSGFVVHDEHYFVELDPGQEVFLNSISSHGEQPAGWRSKSGKGRVCVITPGHFQDVWSHDQFQKLLQTELKRVANG